MCYLAMFRVAIIKKKASFQLGLEHETKISFIERLPESKWKHVDQLPAIQHGAIINL